MQDGSPAGQRSLSGLGTVAFLLFLAAGLAAGLALRHGPSDEPPARAAPEDAAVKSNIVVVMTDDQTLEQMSALPGRGSWSGPRG